MLYEIFAFLIQAVVTLVAGACLLRFAMHALGMSLRGPLGELVSALSDWLVMPLRRVAPPWPQRDMASLLAAWLLKLAQWAFLLLGAERWLVWPVVALLDVLKLGITVTFVVIIAAVVFSWTGNRTWLADTVQRLAEPLFAPFRQLLPRMGGLDLSPIAALILLQVGNIVLRSLQGSLVAGAVPPGFA